MKDGVRFCPMCGTVQNTVSGAVPNTRGGGLNSLLEEIPVIRFTQAV